MLDLSDIDGVDAHASGSVELPRHIAKALLVEGGSINLPGLYNHVGLFERREAAFQPLQREAGKTSLRSFYRSYHFGRISSDNCVVRDILRYHGGRSNHGILSHCHAG